MVIYNYKEKVTKLLIWIVLSILIIFTSLIILKSFIIESQAIAHYPPTGGELVVGTDNSILAYGTGFNTGSWKGTLSYGLGVWSAIPNGTNGLDQQVFIDNVKLNGANKLIIIINSIADSSYNRYFQICDWVSNSYVDNAADSNCTTGGWRTINLNKAYATNTTISNIYTFHIYDGYFTTSTSGNTTVSTPLSNFISNDSNRRIIIRVYSDSTSSVVHSLDYVNVSAIIDTMYSASGFTQITGGSVSSSYISTIGGMISYTSFDASDDVRLEVPGTASAISDFYLSYTNIETYTGMNTILVYSEYSCSTTGINIKPKIYNFNTSSWEDLTSTTIACSATDATNQFAKNNVTVSNYINNGEIRIGWYGSANSTVAIRIDVQYIILGTTNTDSSRCEISWGTGTSTDCTNTRNIDTTATVSAWSLGTEKESSTFSHDFYAFDNDDDGKTDEAQLAANLSFSITPPSNGQIVYLGFAQRIIGSTTMSAMMGFKNYSPAYNSEGGWNIFGDYTGSSYKYQDMTTNSYYYPTTSNEGFGYFGKNENPMNYFQQLTNSVNVRLKTEDCSSKSSTTAAIDFIMVTMSWTEEDDSILTLQSGFLPSSGQLVSGTETTINSNATSGNTGSWKGTLDEDEWGWVVNNSTSTGLNQQIRLDNVVNNGGNKMKIVISASSNSASLTRAYQICDWVSSTNVDSAADTQCTTGGWRTLNIKKANITSTILTAYTWHIYDGYFTTSTTSNTPVSTPLSNFITTDSNKRVLIRAYSAYTGASTHTFDYIGINLIIDTTYFPAGFTQITGDTVSTSYINTINGTLTGQSASDDTYLSVPGTSGAISDFYLSYENVETYIGMNSLVLVSEYSCSTTGINHMPKIYNFSTSSWTDLISTAIACSATDATSQFALNNVTISNYISSGELRIGWYGSANSTVSLRQDMQYIILGTTNTDSSSCEISFGSGTESNCVNTRDLDSTLASPVTWQPETQIETTTLWYPPQFPNDFYGGDFDHDSVLGEYAVSSNITFDLTIPGNALTSSLNYAVRYRSNSTSLTVVPGIKDNSGQNYTIDGGWARINTTSTSTSYTYADGITVGHDDAYFPQHTNDFIDALNNHINIRFSTSASTASSTVTTDIDFAMITFSWLEGTQTSLTQEAYRFYNNDNSTDVGSTLANQNTAATLTSTGQIFRLRLLIAVASASLPMDTEFKLQFAGKGAGSCASPSGTPSTYTDVTTGTAISYYNNSTPTDGTLLTGNTNDPTSSNTILDQTYEEANNFSNSISLIPTSNSGLWDFALYDNGASTSTTYCLKVVYGYSGSGLDTYSNYPEVTTASSTNSAPNSPSSLVQAKTDDTVISVGGWINASSVKFSATASDPNNPDTLYLCIEYQTIGTSFTNTEVGCGTGVSYSGTGVTVTYTASGLSEGQYHWQARVKDSASAYSSWVSYGGNTESERDYGIDTSAPTALSVYDGTETGVDTMFNTGSLSILSANWGSLNADISGLEGYEYSIGTSAGDTSIKTWTDVNTDTSVTSTSLTLQSSQMYFINIRVTDNATNTAVFSSNGQVVLPTLSFTLSSGSITFSNLNPSNSFTDTEVTTLTTSTNAYWGYVIRLFKADSLRSTLYPSTTIADFSGGSYASPDGWLSNDYGFGYTSSDTSIQGTNKFNPTTCDGGNPSPCYAPFSSTGPGDIVADHTATVSGSPVTNEQFDITYKVKTTETQAAGSYTTTLIYTVTPQY